MHIEVQVALNFVISYLYNKLPRRRVNIFGEELEKALKDKFQGHWYPEKPFKGSAFRCLKTGDPIDKVLERAARESGVPIQDVLENLPQELAVWVDPGEVSYRIGEKGAVKVLFSDKSQEGMAAVQQQQQQQLQLQQEEALVAMVPQLAQAPPPPVVVDRELAKPFNPEAQCFRPIESVLGQLSLSPVQPQLQQPVQLQQQQQQQQQKSPPSPILFKAAPPSPVPPPAFIPRTTTPLTFTTATFAQTKFGSTKLKTSSKRANRMSPTEFSNYIKQRAMQQQQLHHHHHHSPGGRALTPDSSAYYFPPPPPPGPFGPQFNAQAPPPPPQPASSTVRSVYESSVAAQFLTPPHDLYGAAMGPPPFYPTPSAGTVGAAPTSGTPPDQDKLHEANAWPYQHLLVAN